MKKFKKKKKKNEEEEEEEEKERNFIQDSQVQVLSSCQPLNSLLTPKGINSNLIFRSTENIYPYTTLHCKSATNEILMIGKNSNAMLKTSLIALLLHYIVILN